MVVTHTLISPPLSIPPRPAVDSPADPEGVEPDLAAGLRRVSREGMGAPLEDLEVQEPGADDEGGEEEGPEEGQEG